MQKVFHPANERGFADHGWLKATPSFSFGSWNDPSKMNFGMLRVLNDDIIAPNNGFSTHPHDNMEIVTIPLKGALAHKDDMGHEEIINANEVQVMSAGTGVLHSEFNPSKTEAANTLQIWVFPDKKDHKPRYDQKSFDPIDRKNRIHTLVSPEKNGDALWINQDAYFSRIDLESGKSISYELHNPNNGVYVFLLDGQIIAGEDILRKRDALGVWNTDHIEMNAAENSSILFIEVPMN